MNVIQKRKRKSYITYITIGLPVRGVFNLRTHVFFACARRILHLLRDISRATEAPLRTVFNRPSELKVFLTSRARKMSKILRSIKKKRWRKKRTLYLKCNDTLMRSRLTRSARFFLVHIHPLAAHSPTRSVVFLIGKKILQYSLLRPSLLVSLNTVLLYKFARRARAPSLWSPYPTLVSGPRARESPARAYIYYIMYCYNYIYPCRVCVENVLLPSSLSHL